MPVSKVTVNRGLRLSSVTSAAVLFCASIALAQTERPAVGPERPFQLAPRIERTLPNGLRVIVTRQTVVPKVSVTLTILSGLSSDPPNLAGLATITGEAIQEGTKLRTSSDIRHQVFGMGGNLSAAASQDYTSITARGLSEFSAGLDRSGCRRGDESGVSRAGSLDPEAAAPAAARAGAGVAAVCGEPRVPGALVRRAPLRTRQRNRGVRQRGES